MLKSRRQAVRVMVGCIVVWFLCGVTVALLPSGPQGAAEPLLGGIAAVLGVVFLVALVNWLLYLNRDINRSRD